MRALAQAPWRAQLCRRVYRHPQYSKADKERMESKRAWKLLDILEKIKLQLKDNFLERVRGSPTVAKQLNA